MESSLSKLHILFVPSWYISSYQPYNGVYFQEQAIALERMGHQVGIIYPRLNSIRRTARSFARNLSKSRITLDSEISTTIIEGINTRSEKINLTQWRILVNKLFADYTSRYGLPDIIHAQGAIWGGIAVSDLAERYRVPLVIGEHSSSFESAEFSKFTTVHLKKAYSRAAYLYGVCSHVSEKIRNYTSKDVAVIPNPVDHKSIYDMRRVEKDGKTIICIATLREIKRVSLLIEAFALLVRDIPDINLVIVGDGEEKQKLKIQIKKLGVEGNVAMVGTKSRYEIAGILSSSDLLVLPSRFETFGIVLLEALCCGVPVLTTAMGGPVDFIRESEGAVVYTDEPQVLYKAMLNELNRPFDREILKSYARRFSLENFGTELDGVYRRMVALASAS